MTALFSRIGSVRIRSPDPGLARIDRPRSRSEEDCPKKGSKRNIRDSMSPALRSQRRSHERKLTVNIHLPLRPYCTGTMFFIVGKIHSPKLASPPEVVPKASSSRPQLIVHNGNTNSVMRCAMVVPLTSQAPKRSPKLTHQRPAAMGGIRIGVPKSRCERAHQSPSSNIL